MDDERGYVIIEIYKTLLRNTGWLEVDKRTLAEQAVTMADILINEINRAQD